MSRKVILIRHAKSSWGDPMADDHERTLNGRGRKAAPLIGKWLVEEGHDPDLFLVSDATRTKETADLIRAAWDTPAPVTYDADLYLAAPQTMLEALQATTAPCVALIAHNPGMAMLAKGLLTDPPYHPRFLDYPTGATTVINFEGDIAPGIGHCINFVTPHELA